MDTSSEKISEPHRRPFAGVAKAAFGTLSALAVPGCLLTTAAYFTASPAVFAQLSPFRVQYTVLLAAHALFGLTLGRYKWAAFFAGFAVFNLWAVLGPGFLPDANRPAAATNASIPATKILFANVLTSNPDPSRLLTLIASEKPDLIALVEINHRWQTQLSQALLRDYPYASYRPREDNFGVAVLSRRPMSDEHTEFFADAEIPSLAFSYPAVPSPIRILVTHPFPPGTPAGTRLRDQQLAEVANWSIHTTQSGSSSVVTPTLILGDLNSTPWCPPLRRLLAEAQLGFASKGHMRIAATWPSAVPFLRIPLDHALLNQALACTAYRVGPDIGSDHFPVLLKVRATLGNP